MEANKYERTYVSVREAQSAVHHVDDVVAFLRDVKKPVSCKEIGLAIYGDDYLTDARKRMYASELGQILHHLYKGHFISIHESKGDPIEIEVEEWIDDDDVARYIKVHDDEGNSYLMPNPKYNPFNRHGHWGTVKKTVHPTVKTYSWIGY